MHTDAPPPSRTLLPARRPEAVEQPPLGQQVYLALRARLIDGRLRPGEKLSDLRLGTELQVSRTPVREALYRLAQEGVVQVNRRRGFAVARMTRRDVRELYEIRLGLEVLAVRLGGPQLGKAALAQAQAAHDAMAVLMLAGAEGAGAFDLADWQLHHSLFVAARNRRLLSLREGLQTQLDVLRVYGLRPEPLILVSIEHHAAILVALAAGDWLAAERAMAHHIAEMQAPALALFDEHES